MTFEKGKSGNPAGRPPGKDAFATAIRVALDAKGEDGRSAREAIIEKVVILAIGGDLRAIEFLRDSTDGKPAQTLKHQGDEDKPLRVTVGPHGKV